MGIEIREITTLDELYQIQKIEEIVWQETPIPIHQTLTVLHNGGVLIGAFLGGNMIGFQYSFPGFDGQEVYLVSHALGILPAYRKSGLGEKIKRKQREVAAGKGYDKMIWIYDPLESVNAYLNLHKLGGIATTYKENYYGTMDDGLNKGLPSDRLVIEWDFHKDTKPFSGIFNSSQLLLEMGQEMEPRRTDVVFDGDSEQWFVAIPAHIQDLKERNIERAIQWRSSIRELFQLLFSNGYTAKDIIRDEYVSYYYFEK